MFGLDMDAQYTLESISALMNPESYVANEGSIDNLGVRFDGSIYDDGDNSKVTFADGRKDIELGEGLGYQSALEAWLRKSGVAGFNAYTSLIKQSGNRLVDGSWTSKLDISRDGIDAALRDGKISLEQYDMIIGSKRSESDVAAMEQKGLRSFQAAIKAKYDLASLIEGTMIVPGSITLGSGKAGDPYVSVDRAYSQIDFAKETGFEEVGPCYLMANCSPFQMMGVSQEALFKALAKLPTGIIKDGSDGGKRTAEFMQDSSVLWTYLQKELKTPGIPSWFGGKRQEMDWATFEASGATMGLLWMDNPKRDDPESQHWGFLNKIKDSWYFQEHYDKASKGIFGAWGVNSWAEITTYSIRPLQITTP